MSGGTISFDDGAAYEQMMVAWSQLVGDVFVSWLAAGPGLGWIDIGCGNGAFTQLLVDRCAPSEVHGIDPAEGQLVFARARPCARLARFSKGDAMVLPFPNNRFDAAVMALAIFYAPDPVRAVSEMVRVVKPGGIVSTYIWDILEGRSPTGPVQAEMQAMGIAPLNPPSVAASRMGALHTLWTQAGLDNIRSREIMVTRDFGSFDDFWATILLQPNIGKPVSDMTRIMQNQLKLRVRSRLPIASDGRLRYSATANAISGRKPEHAGDVVADNQAGSNRSSCEGGERLPDDRASAAGGAPAPRPEASLRSNDFLAFSLSCVKDRRPAGPKPAFGVREGRRRPRRAWPAVGDTPCL